MCRGLALGVFVTERMHAGLVLAVIAAFLTFGGPLAWYRSLDVSVALRKAHDIFGISLKEIWTWRSLQLRGSNPRASSRSIALSCKWMK